jgi:hypothetical protein
MKFRATRTLLSQSKDRVLRHAVRLGSVFRTVLLSVRTLLIWLANLFIFYILFHGKGGIGENFDRVASPIQLAGFAVLLAGTLLYSQGCSAVARDARAIIKDVQDAFDALSAADAPHGQSGELSEPRSPSLEMAARSPPAKSTTIGSTSSSFAHGGASPLRAAVQPDADPFGRSPSSGDPPTNRGQARWQPLEHARMRRTAEPRTWLTPRHRMSQDRRSSEDISLARSLPVNIRGNANGKFQAELRRVVESGWLESLRHTPTGAFWTPEPGQTSPSPHVLDAGAALEN